MKKDGKGQLSNSFLERKEAMQSEVSSVSFRVQQAFVSGFHVDPEIPELEPRNWTLDYLEADKVALTYVEF